MSLANLFLFFILLFSACQSSPPKSLERSKEEEYLLAHPEDAAIIPPVLKGLWISAGPERAGNGRFLMREYSFEYGKAVIKFIWGADRDFRRVLLMAKSEAIFSVEETSPKNKFPIGAYFVSFKPTKKTLFLYHRDPEFLSDMDLNGCGLIPGKEKEVSAGGCGDFLSLRDCPEEFDLVRQTNKELFFGERPPNEDICAVDKRPEQMSFPLHQK